MPFYQPSGRKSVFIFICCLGSLFLGHRILPYFLSDDRSPGLISNQPHFFPPTNIGEEPPAPSDPPHSSVNETESEPIPPRAEDPPPPPPPPEEKELEPVDTPHPNGIDESRSKRIADKVSDRLRRELRAQDLLFGDPVFMRVFKDTSEFELWVHHRSTGAFKKFKDYPIARFSGRLGPKQKEGDYQAPEGFYSVTRRSMNPKSNYHLSFNLGYPNAYDRSHGRTGSFLMVHGSNVSVGCFAMTDPAIEEIYTLADAALKRGQDTFHVHSFPYRMNRSRPRGLRTTEWDSFWENLKEGFDIFEAERRVPTVSVSNQRYRFQ